MLRFNRKLWWTKISASALGAMLILPVASTVNGQGPVRNTARGVAQGAANLTRGVAQGTANTLQRTGQATRNIVRGATPPYNGRVTSNYRGGVQANGAIVQDQTYGQTQYNQTQYGQTQYGQPVAQGQTWNDSQVQPATTYGTSQYGVTQGYANSGQVYRLRHDAQGREFICQNGSRVYFTRPVNYESSQPMNENSQSMNSQNNNNQNQNWSNESDSNANSESGNQPNQQNENRSSNSNQDNSNNAPDAPQPSTDAEVEANATAT